MDDVGIISQALMEARKNMLRKANVVGLGAGWKETANRRTNDLSIKVLVREKLPLTALDARDVVPKEWNGIPTDVTAVGHIHAHSSPRERVRPAVPGVSIGHYAVTAGTFGAVVRDARSGRRFILSNNHVLADSNHAAAGDLILQPAASDGGRRSNDGIAALERFVKLQFKGGTGENGGSSCFAARFAASFLNMLASLFGSKTRLAAIQSFAANLVDAAVASPFAENLISDEIAGIGKVQGTAQGALGMRVKKSGRTTGLTEGEITVLDATVEIGYGGPSAVFEHQLVATAMSEPGDSGSLVLDEQNRAVGLLFAGSESVTVINPIDAVLTALNLTF